MSSSSNTSTSKKWMRVERTLSRTLTKSSYLSTLGLLPLTEIRVCKTGRVKMDIRVKTTGELITMITSKICLEHLSVKNHSSNLKKMLTNITILRRAMMLAFTHFIQTQWVEIRVSTIPCIRMVTLFRRWSFRWPELPALSSIKTCVKPIMHLKRPPILTKLLQRPTILTKLWCLQAWAKVKQPLKDRNLREYH